MSAAISTTPSVPPGAINLHGHTYGRLTVERLMPPRPGRQGVEWLCRCACGQEVVTETRRLRHGDLKQCKACAFKMSNGPKVWTEARVAKLREMWGAGATDHEIARAVSRIDPERRAVTASTVSNYAQVIGLKAKQRATAPKPKGKTPRPMAAMPPEPPPVPVLIEFPEGRQGDAERSALAMLEKVRSLRDLGGDVIDPIAEKSGLRALYRGHDGLDRARGVVRRLVGIARMARWDAWEARGQ